MSGNFVSTQTRNITLEGKWCEGKFLFNLGQKMATSGFFKWFFPFSSLDLKSHNRY